MVNTGGGIFGNVRMPPTMNIKFLQANLNNENGIAIFASKGNINIKRDNNSIGQVRLMGGSQGYDVVFEVNIDKGRYFNRRRTRGGQKCSRHRT